jgi:3-oxoacyl-[acyl-carrier-protein] synthase III
VNLFIAGVSAYIPKPICITEAIQKGWYDEARARRAGWTGVAVADSESAPEMAVHAGRCALARSGLRPDEIDILLHSESYHSGPDVWYPQHYILRQTVGRPIPTLALRHGCTAMIQAIELAGCWLERAGTSGGALLTAADRVGTPQFDRWNYTGGRATPTNNLVLGDAGSAMVLSTHSGVARVLAIRSGSLPELEPLFRGDEPLYPPGSTAGTHIQLGARMRAVADRHPGLAAGAGRLLREARTELGRQTLEEAGVRAADITRVTHVFAGQRRYLEDLLGPLGIDPDRGLLEYGRGVGHLTVNDHAAGLDHLLEAGTLRPGDHLMMIGNGAGVSIACAVLQISAGRRPGEEAGPGRPRPAARR